MVSVAFDKYILYSPLPIFVQIDVFEPFLGCETFPIVVYPYQVFLINDTLKVLLAAPYVGADADVDILILVAFGKFLNGPSTDAENSKVVLKVVANAVIDKNGNSNIVDNNIIPILFFI